MNKAFILTYLLLISILGSAQENPHDPQLQTDLKVKQLMEKKATFNKLNYGEYDGFRIKIHSGVDRVKAREVKSKFAGKFQDYTPYEDYDQPNFIIIVGDFRTRIEAHEAWKKIQLEFPNSFIVKSRIRPMKL